MGAEDEWIQVSYRSALTNLIILSINLLSKRLESVFMKKCPLVFEAEVSSFIKKVIYWKCLYLYAFCLLEISKRKHKNHGFRKKVTKKQTNTAVKK